MQLTASWPAAGVSPSPVASSDVWNSDAVKAALQTVGDTSGHSSLDQQLSAFNLISNLWTSGPVGGDRVAVLTQFSDTAFVKEVGAAGDTLGRAQATPPGSSDLAVAKQGLTAFNGLTARQQEILTSVYNNAATNGPYATGRTVSGVDGYRAMLQAEADLAQVLDGPTSSGELTPARMSDPSQIKDAKLAALVRVADRNGSGDDWTSQIRAALADYGSGPATPTPAAVSITLSPEAQAKLVASPKPATPTSAVSGSDVGLSLLKDAAHRSTSTPAAQHSSAGAALDISA